MQTNKKLPKKYSNEYYVCLEQMQEPISFDPAEPSQAILDAKPDCAYFSKVLEILENQLEAEGLTFYITWNVRTLPSYGRNVIAIVLGDEWCRIPAYSNKIRAIFKGYGTQPTLGYNFIFSPSYLSFINFIHFLRIVSVYIPSWINYQTYKLVRQPEDNAAPIYAIPLGYYKQIELPLKPLLDRSYDIYFSGSIAQRKYSKNTLKFWIGEPKSISREKMILNLKKLNNKHQNLKVKLSLTDSFQSSSSSNAEVYSEELMNSKICLAPRGTSFETFRFFEALRYGCIVVTEVLPSRWFYDGAPIIQIADWSELEEVLKSLVENVDLMQKKHYESLNWWKNQCSETAVGTYIAERIKETFKD
jgi:hypothetical protein